MDELPLSLLFTLLGALLLLSAFFSGSETALMAINRYRLRHAARQGHRGAVLASRLLERPDRLIGLILLGNNLVNVLASMLTTLIALRLSPDDTALAVAAGLLTLVLLIFSEVAPKTLAALHPERLAYPAAYVYTGLLKVGWPVVFLVNLLANTLLRLIGVKPDQGGSWGLTREELLTVVKEAGGLLPGRHRSMLVNVLQLEHATVEDVMVPRNEIAGLDLAEPIEQIRRTLRNAPHTRLPVWREDIDHIVGILHLRRLLNRLVDDSLDHKAIEAAMSEPYFVPEGTPLTTQLLNFQTRRERMALVVDEYGDLLGLVTLEDILEEIVGEFTTGGQSITPDIHPLPDGSYLVDGGVHLRELKRVLDWKLPPVEPKTLNGLILEYLEAIPEPGTGLILYGMPMEIVKIQGPAVKTVRIHPQWRRDGGGRGH